MKILLLSLFALVSSFAQAAELQVFENYNAAKKTYSAKHVSRSEKALSAAVLFNERTGACFKAKDEAELNSLFAEMVDLYREETGYPVEFQSSLRGTGNDRAFAYEVRISTETEVITWSSVKTRECVR